jgi:hypothetical protein
MAFSKFGGGRSGSTGATAATSTGGASKQLRTRIKDDKGHYERWPEVRVHPDLDTAARTFLADSACEFESMADLIRGCVLDALPRFRTSNPNTKSTLAILRAIEEENNRSEMRRRFTQHITETAREAFELVGEGRTGEAAKHVHRVLMHIRGMDKDDPWRDEFERTIKQKFGHLLRLTRASSFHPGDGVDEEGLAYLDEFGDEDVKEMAAGWFDERPM